jgi:hypothetical protein
MTAMQVEGPNGAGTLAVGKDVTQARDILFKFLRKNDNHYGGVELAFEPVSSHTMRDQMGDKVIVPDGFFVTGENLLIKKAGLMDHFKLERPKSYGLGDGKKPIQAFERKKPIPLKDIAQQLKETLKKHGVDDQHAVRLLKNGVWVSQYAIDAMLAKSERYFTHFNCEYGAPYYGVDVKTLGGEVVAGDDLMDVVESGIIKAGLDPEKIGLTLVANRDGNVKDHIKFTNSLSQEEHDKIRGVLDIDGVVLDLRLGLKLPMDQVVMR